MYNFKFSKESLRNLEGVHPDLIAVANLALRLAPVDFKITEGLRTKEKQEQRVSEGKSKTMNSRHLTGHAIDVVALPKNKVSWDWQYYEFLARTFKHAARILGIPIEWGGDWITFKDGVHFQLPWKEYPK